MKKIFTLITTALLGGVMCANAQKIAWTETASAGTLNGTSFTNGELALTVTDTKSKVSVDENTAYFGTADNYQKFDFRLKTGGKSTSDNMLTLTIPTNGTLNVYARTGKNSDTDRNIVVTQNGTDLINKVLLESEAVKGTVEGETEQKNIYPVISASIVEGTASITYPTNSVNIYCIELVTANGIKTILTPASDANAPVYNLAGQQVTKDYKGVCIQNGRKFINK